MLLFRGAQTCSITFTAIAMTALYSLIEHTEIFPWSENFETGIEIIDDQHRKLVDLLNKLAGHLARGSDELTLYAVYDDLTDYAAYHFQTEEGIWGQYLNGDEVVQTHGKSHQDFVAEVLRIRQQTGALADEEAVEELVSFLTHWLAFHILEDDALMARIVQAVQLGETLEWAKEQAADHMSGAARVLIEAVLKMYDSLSARTLALLREVSKRQKVEEKLRLSSNIIESSTEAIFITDTQGRITDANPAFCRDVQCSLETLLNQPIRAVKPTLFDSENGQQVWDIATQKGHWAGEMSSRRFDGESESVWLTLSTVKDDDLKTVHYVGMLSSISQLVERHHAMVSVANHDSLTGLPNRRLLEDRLLQTMERSKRNSTVLAVCFLDLDGFKLINDTHGHDVGDVVLNVVAQRMTQVLRGVDTVARIGGDEFVLLLSDLAHSQEAAQLIERVLFDITLPIQVGGSVLHIGASLGATLYPEDTGSTDALLKHADVALYQAKAQGKGCFRFYTTDQFETQTCA
jgi:diguanylate cyclase (GGDEF)-like protein/hemerythrin-like metal-binding protein/PAS domain S-box-containing protein